MTPNNNEGSSSSAVAAPPEFQFLGFSGRWPATFRSLRHRNFRLFWFGQIISLLGSWMQWAAQGWLIAILVKQQLHTENASWYLSFIGIMGSLPMMFLTLYGGTLADKYDRRRMLILTQSLLILPALALGLLCMLQVVRIWHIAAIAVVTGIINALDMPVRQSFVKDMAGHEDLPNAIALNSTIFNAARSVGPLIAGLLMSYTRIGLAGVFILNAASYLAVIWGLNLIRHKHVSHVSANTGTLSHLKEGFLYVAGNSAIRLLLTLMAVYSIFAFSTMVLMPTVAIQLHLKEIGYTSLLSSVGWGALAGALLFATVHAYVGKGRILLIGGLLCSLGLMSFSLSHNYHLSLSILPFVGAGLVVSTACINSLIQQLAPDHLRGRIVSIWTFIFAGFGPIGLLYVGLVGQFVSPATAIFIGGLLCLLVNLFFFITTSWFFRQP